MPRTDNSALGEVMRKNNEEEYSLKYNIHFFGMTAICPRCSGLLRNTQKIYEYRCIDCKTVFRIVDEGLTDKEAICETDTRLGEEEKEC